jgi:hypothetical protein
LTWSAFVLLAVLVSLDMQNLASRWARVVSLGEETSSDYTLIVPIFGDPKYFRNGEYLGRFRDRTLLAVNVDSPKMRRFVSVGRTPQEGAKRGGDRGEWRRSTR